MNEKLLEYLQKPELYEPSTHKFWDDEYISKNMLEAHLNTHFDAATRRYDFVVKSVAWITKIAPPDNKNKLLDLGCGPGIYTELFKQKGYDVTGVDLSQRSIDYAQNSAKEKGLDIKYICKNYLELNLQEKYDVITLIYCDYAALSDKDRELLLKYIYSILKPNGILVFDVFTKVMYSGQEEYKKWYYTEKPDFWCDMPHGCLSAMYMYGDNTQLRQSIIVTDNEIRCYNIWDHMFNCEELGQELNNAGNWNIDFYGDVAGNQYTDDSKTICVVAYKN